MMTDADDRLHALDALRGLAVMGVMLANAAAIAMPYALSIMPGGPARDPVGAATWLAQFVLLDGKARALLAMIFGAATLLVIDRAEMDGRDGLAAQRQRLLWLLPIGAAHFLFLWDGDILILLALGGLLALRLVAAEPIDLVKWALLCFLLQWLTTAAVVTPGLMGGTPGEHADLLQRDLVRELGIYRADYTAIVFHRTLFAGPDLAALILHALPELLGFMLLGMAMAKGGFFAGQWMAAQYRDTAIRAGLFGFAPALLLGLWAIVARDSRVVEAIQFVGALPFRIPATVAIAAALMLLARARRLPRLEAVGRLALSNYLLTSLIVTSLAYGYGLGLYGRLDRPALLGLGLLLSLAALLWSRPWLTRLGQGPAERLWRRLYVTRS